jgi:hypothetical protein
MNEEVILERLNNLINDNKEEHKSILAQVTKTNGSVADIQRWRYIATGVILLMNVLILPIILAVVIQYVLKVI